MISRMLISHNCFFSVTSSMENMVTRSPWLGNFQVRSSARLWVPLLAPVAPIWPHTIRHEFGEQEIDYDETNVTTAMNASTSAMMNTTSTHTFSLKKGTAAD